jgi:hypothetical protein
MHPRGNDLHRWRVLRPVYRFSWVVAPLRGMLVFCHVGYAACKSELAKGGFSMSKARPATPTVAFIDDYCAR